MPMSSVTAGTSGSHSVSAGVAALSLKVLAFPALLTHPWVGSLDQVGSCVGSTVEIFSVGRCRLDLGSQPVAGGRVATASSAACPLPVGEGRGTAGGGWPGRSGRILEGGGGG